MRIRGLLAGALLCCAAAPAAAQRPEARVTVDAAHVEAVRAVMRDLRVESRRDARRIEEAFARQTGRLADRDQLTRALAAGTMRPMPLAEPAFNVRLRMTGAHPIGERDLAYQGLYAAGDPAALGVLLQVASRVRSTSLDVTSLVRHDAYQRSLAASNPNARTPLPIHTFGLAFDISVLHAPLASVREIRDVLRQMRDDGDVFFVAEVRQLVFHVVVAPGRAPYHAAVFDALVAAPPPLWRPSPLPTGYAARGIESLFPLLVRYEQPLAGSFGPPMLVGLSAVAAVWRRRAAARPCRS